MHMNTSPALVPHPPHTVRDRIGAGRRVWTSADDEARSVTFPFQGRTLYGYAQLSAAGKEGG